MLSHFSKKKQIIFQKKQIIVGCLASHQSSRSSSHPAMISSHCLLQHTRRLCPDNNSVFWHSVRVIESMDTVKVIFQKNKKIQPKLYVLFVMVYDCEGSNLESFVWKTVLRSQLLMLLLTLVACSFLLLPRPLLRGSQSPLRPLPLLSMCLLPTT